MKQRKKKSKNKSANKTEKRPQKEKIASPESSSTSESDDEICLYCCEPYSKTIHDGWIQCTACKKWAHDNCAVDDEDDDFSCEFCR